MKILGTVFSRALIACIYIFLLAPILIVLVASVSTTNYLTFPPQGFTLRWFLELETLDNFISAFQYSAMVAVCSTALSIVVGTWIALAITRLEFPGKQALTTFFLAPLILPELAFAIGILQYFNAIGGLQGLSGLMLAHSVICVPYIIRTVLAAATSLNASLEESAQTLGAPPWLVLRDVTLPLLRPGLVAGAVMAFIISFDNVVISVFLSAPGQITLPALLFNQASETGLNSTIAAVCALLILSMMIVMVLLERFMGLEALLRTTVPGNEGGSK